MVRPLGEADNYICLACSEQILNLCIEEPLIFHVTSQVTSYVTKFITRKACSHQLFFVEAHWKQGSHASRGMRHAQKFN